MRTWLRSCSCRCDFGTDAIVLEEVCAEALSYSACKKSSVISSRFLEEGRHCRVSLCQVTLRITLESKGLE